jgi:hypothetical protein
MTDEIFSQTYTELGVSGIRLKEDFLTTFHSISTIRNHFLFDLVEKTLQNLLSSGIYQQNYNYAIWDRFRQVKEVEDSEPKVLSVEDLKFGFVVWICTCGVSILVFVLELIMKKFVRILIDFLALNYFVKNLRFE